MNDKTTAATDTSHWTIIKLIRWAASYLKSYDIDSPRATGEILLAHALHLNRIDLYLKYDQPLVADELQSFKALIKRRVRREPVAYILGIKEFWSLELEVNADVLIPRPETECLVETALDLMSRESSRLPQRILDLGTGSGAICWRWLHSSRVIRILHRIDFGPLSNWPAGMPGDMVFTTRFTFLSATGFQLLIVPGRVLI